MNDQALAESIHTRRQGIVRQRAELSGTLAARDRCLAMGDQEGAARLTERANRIAPRLTEAMVTASHMAALLPGAGVVQAPITASGSASTTAVEARIREVMPRLHGERAALDRLKAERAKATRERNMAESKRLDAPIEQAAARLLATAAELTALADQLPPKRTTSKIAEGVGGVHLREHICASMSCTRCAVSV